MKDELTYITDRKGKKTSVVIPVQTWKKINVDYNKLLKKVEVLTGVAEGIKEIKTLKKSGAKLQSLNDLLNESHR